MGSGGKLSVNAMADRASAASAQRRLRSGGAVRTRQQPSAAGDSSASDRAVGEATRAIVAYIPAEIVAVYVAAIGVIYVPGAKPAGGQWLLMWVILALTPFTIWATYALKNKNVTGLLPVRPHSWPWLQMILASAAFELWAFSLPGSPFDNFSWYKPALGSVALLIGTFLIGWIASLVEPAAS